MLEDKNINAYLIQAESAQNEIKEMFNTVDETYFNLHNSLKQLSRKLEDVIKSIKDLQE